MSILARRGAVAAALAVVAALLVSGAVAQSCPLSPINCDPATFVSCSASVDYAKGTLVSALPSPLGATGVPLGQSITCRNPDNGQVIPPSDLYLFDDLKCPGPLSAATTARVCKTGCAVVAACRNVTVFGFCNSTQAPSISCTNKNITCSTPGDVLTASMFGCTASPPAAQLFVDTKLATTCGNGTNKVHIVSGKSAIGCYSVNNVGTFTTAGDKPPEPQNPCDPSICPIPPNFCFSGCCLGAGELQASIAWGGGSDLDLEVTNTNCTTNSTFPNGTPFCTNILNPRGPMRPRMDKITTLPTCTSVNPAPCGSDTQKNAENIFIPSINGALLFSATVKAKTLCGPFPVTFTVRLLYGSIERVFEDSFTSAAQVGTKKVYFLWPGM